MKRKLGTTKITDYYKQLTKSYCVNHTDSYD